MFIVTYFNLEQKGAISFPFEEGSIIMELTWETAQETAEDMLKGAEEQYPDDDNEVFIYEIAIEQTTHVTYKKTINYTKLGYKLI